MTAPERIRVARKIGTGLRDVMGGDRGMSSGYVDLAEYILATPEAISKAPEVQELIAEAQREAIQMCQDAVQKLRREAGATANGIRFQALDDARNAIRNAAIRALKKGE